MLTISEVIGLIPPDKSELDLLKSLALDARSLLKPFLCIREGLALITEVSSRHTGVIVQRKKKKKKKKLKNSRVAYLN